MIADLSVNHVERHALLCGFTVERLARDYGIDLTIATYNATGEIENEMIRVQVKATDHLQTVSGGQFIVLRVGQQDLHYWLRETMPVILIVYDAPRDVGYWLYVQAYFENQPGFRLPESGARVTIRIPSGNVLNQAAMRKFAAFRDALLAQRKGVVHHG